VTAGGGGGKGPEPKSASIGDFAKPTVVPAKNRIFLDGDLESSVVFYSSNSARVLFPARER
jgi:hypothetical protein